MDLEVRLIKPDEVERFFRFFSKSIMGQFPEYTPRTKRFILEKPFSVESIKEDTFRYRERFTLVALVKGEYSGFLMSESPYGGVMVCNWLAVKKEFQGKGVATGLLEKWAEVSGEMGAHKLLIWTDKRNVEFYRKRGFRLVGKVEKNYFGHDDYLLHRGIQEPKESRYLR